MIICVYFLYFSMLKLGLFKKEKRNKEAIITMINEMWKSNNETTPWGYRSFWKPLNQQSLKGKKRSALPFDKWFDIS